jgi:hypothetical protein
MSIALWNLGIEIVEAENDDLHDTAHYDKTEHPDWAPFEFKMQNTKRKIKF